VKRCGGEGGPRRGRGSAQALPVAAPRVRSAAIGCAGRGLRPRDESVLSGLTRPLPGGFALRPRRRPARSISRRTTACRRSWARCSVDSVTSLKVRTGRM